MGTDPYALTPERLRSLEAFVDDLLNEADELDQFALEKLLARNQITVVMRDDVPEAAQLALDAGFDRGYDKGIRDLEEMLIAKDNTDAVLARSDRRSPPTRCIPVEVISDYADGLLEGE